MCFLRLDLTLDGGSWIYWNSVHSEHLLWSTTTHIYNTLILPSKLSAICGIVNLCHIMSGWCGTGGSSGLNYYPMVLEIHKIIYICIRVDFFDDSWLAVPKRAKIQPLVDSPLFLECTPLKYFDFQNDWNILIFKTNHYIVDCFKNFLAMFHIFTWVPSLVSM